MLILRLKKVVKFFGETGSLVPPEYFMRSYFKKNHFSAKINSFSSTWKFKVVHFFCNFLKVRLIWLVVFWKPIPQIWEITTNDFFFFAKPRPILSNNLRLFPTILIRTHLIRETFIISRQSGERRIFLIPLPLTPLSQSPR